MCAREVELFAVVSLLESLSGCVAFITIHLGPYSPIYGVVTLTYARTANNKAGRKPPHTAVSDTSDGVRRAAAISLKSPIPRIVQLLRESCYLRI